LLKLGSVYKEDQTISMRIS